MPLLRNPDKSKLSKRKNPTSINYYRDMGYLPEAVVNYLGMMGWSMPSGEEKFSLQEMEDSFDINRVSLGGPIFDVEKLSWLNGRYLRENLSDEEFAARFVQWATAGGRLERVVPLLKERVERFTDVVGLGSLFIDGVIQLQAEHFKHKQLDNETMVKILQYSLWRLEALPDWDRDSIESCFQELASQLQLKIRDFLFPLFIVISGKAVSTSVIESVAILGLDISRARIRHGIDVLGGVSKKAAKRLESEFQNL
jgi:glutamyl-tRNA synthetase